MKNFGRVGVVELYRDNAWAIPYSAKKEDPKPNDKKK